MNPANVHSNGNRRARRMFGTAVCAAAIGATGAGVLTTPPQEAPSYALNSEVVYRCEITLAVFVAAYLLIASVALAVEGRTMGKVSTSGIELPTEISSSISTQRELIAWLDQLHQRMAERDERLYRDIESFRKGLAHRRHDGSRREE